MSKYFHIQNPIQTNLTLLDNIKRFTFTIYIIITQNSQVVKTVLLLYTHLQETDLKHGLCNKQQAWGKARLHAVDASIFDSSTKLAQFLILRKSCQFLEDLE